MSGTVKTDALPALAAAFPHTVPVMAGYVFMGLAFGILLQGAGYGAGWAALMSLVIFAGSMQFVAVNLLVLPFSPLNALLITLMVNARHLFYGFSMLEKFKDMGRVKPYLIFGLTDETFSLLWSVAPPPKVNPRLFRFFVTLLDQLYWVTGGVLGALVGGGLPFDTRGIEFAMTALFVSICTEQLRDRSKRPPALIGLAGSALCLALLGSQRFMLPTMLLLILIFTALRGPLERGMGHE